MRMILTAAGILIALAIVTGLSLLVWGTRLPETHTASAAEVIPGSEADVFQRIHDVGAHAKWRGGVKTIEVLDGGRWVEEGENGPVPFRVVESAPPSRLVVRIDTDQLPFEGTWTYSLAAVAGGTRVEIVEDGRVKNAMFRAMGRLFFPHDKTMKAFLADLRRSFS
jgi:uncharacterized protein YndB with AHSA1/START domain